MTARLSTQKRYRTSRATLGTVATADFTQLVIVISGIAMIITVGVYALVAGIVKLDNAGLALTQQSSSSSQTFGAGILWFAPRFMRTLTVVGTAAMFMVGGGILTHCVGVLGHWTCAFTVKANRPRINSRQFLGAMS